MSRGKIVVIYGTRPEAIKLGPVVAELREQGLSPTIICTGQHSDLLRGTPAESDLAGSLSLGLPSNGNVWEWVNNAVPEIRIALEEQKPVACVVVQGDTMSAYAGALAACQMLLPVAHVEAGLRSHRADEPWPEEGIRQKIAQLADIHFAPTATACRNLYREKARGQLPILTGNTVVSALERYAKGVKPQIPTPQIFVTMHRREWVDKGQFHVLRTIDALYEGARKHSQVRFLWPMHPNVLRVSGIDPRQAPKNVLISPPLAYRESVSQLARSMGAITDSGGVQEEAGVLGVPCAVMREVTDRPESVDAGVAKLFRPDPDGITRAIACLTSYELPRLPIPDYGTPLSARKIADFLGRMS